ncbi:MAG: HD domain-containing protein [Nocardioidaceae bacterium]
MSDLDRFWPLEDTRAREQLVAAYAGRDGYHDLTHLREVLERIDELLGAGGEGDEVGADRDAVLLAAWFHDAVYDAGGHLEERSAVLAERVLRAAGVAEPTVLEVARLVRVTREHRPEDGDVDGAVLCDADLAILAADADRYRAYVDGVRREYAHVPDPDFAVGRAAVLQALMDKPTLFHTPHARTHWEQRARANLERELGSLRH